jgi:hypothetical protein
MQPSTLACGPYFEPSGLVMSAAIFVLFKPLAYFAFVQTFRYRVSRAIPMRIGQAAWLAVLRTLVGLLLIGGGTIGFLALGADRRGMMAWIYMYGARVAAWWAIGRYGASLRGRRLVGWIVAGMLLNIAFDVAVGVGLFAGWLWPAGILVLIAGFIGILHQLGQRESLKARFSGDPLCRACMYNLTGNLSGICPECGTPIAPTAWGPLRRE